jgi:hypothetical protein
MTSLKYTALVSQTAQDIAVTDGVETAVAKWHLGTVRDGDPTTIRHPVFRRPLGRDLQAAHWKVHEHGVAARSLGEIETGPTSTGTDIQ